MANPETTNLDGLFDTSLVEVAERNSAMDELQMGKDFFENTGIFGTEASEIQLAMLDYIVSVGIKEGNNSSFTGDIKNLIDYLSQNFDIDDEQLKIIKTRVLVNVNNVKSRQQDFMDTLINNVGEEYAQNFYNFCEARHFDDLTDIDDLALNMQKENPNITMDNLKAVEMAVLEMARFRVGINYHIAQVRAQKAKKGMEQLEALKIKSKDTIEKA
ncbi:MAG: hypothetical protein N4A38_01260 [Candidatus Gracilibacteria bacterium]|nr:hypothetical protein [Candidatus Gracilibacteria bacterium]